MPGGNLLCAPDIYPREPEIYMRQSGENRWDFCLEQLKIAVLIALFGDLRADKLLISSLDGGCRK